MFEQARYAQGSSYGDELDSTWLLPRWHHAHRGQHMSSRAVTRLIAHEAEKQEIPMTCSRIQFAGAVDALRRGEQPTDVFGRLGYEPTKTEVEVATKRSLNETGVGTPR
ncbi:hypothetical protein SMC7_01945 [Candidatus Cryosericum terrychapinii]|uniref:Uncharacterized protein n=2 Tax=Candidatus Cryosericum terrychapinii TaxID=2290919 RepID=A0A398CVF6_9BACT|nr:hypothetical protein SMC7_01945 [Candidatus Cryosericum terrychapinii]